MNDAFGRPQNVLVVGANSDIASALIELLDPTVQRLALATRNPPPEESESRRHFAFEATSPAEHEGLVADVVDWMGDIDLAVVAHGDLGAPFSLDVEPAEVARLVTVNHSGAASISQAIARRLAKQGHGTLTVLSSVAAVRPRLANLPYASSKAGIDSFAMGLDHALADTGARVMVVRPGFVRSKMTEHLDEQPLSVDPSEVAEAIVKGLAKNSSVVWVPAALGAAPVFRLMPKAIWRRLSQR